MLNLLPFLLLWNFSQAPDFSVFREGVQVEACQQESHAHDDEDLRIKLLIKVEKLNPCGFTWATEHEVGQLTFSPDFKAVEISQLEDGTVTGKPARITQGRFGAIYYCNYCKQALVIQLRKESE